MGIKKRALALLPGLFLFILLPHPARADSPGRRAAAFSLEADAGTLLVTDEGASIYGGGGLELELFPDYTPESKFFLGFTLGRFSSSLPWLEGSVSGFSGSFRAETPALGIRLSSGIFDESFFSADGIEARGESVSFSSEGGRGFFFNLEMPARAGPLIIEPSLLYGEGAWEEGDLYWFLGKPDIPGLFVWGLFLRLDPADTYTSYEGVLGHELGFRLFRADLDLLSNEERVLFKSDPGAGFVSYTISLERSAFDFSGTLGGLFVNVPVSGELTSANQHYFLFPYLSYKVRGSFSAAAGFSGFDFGFRAGVFRCGIKIGALHVFGDSGSVDTNYEKKPLYGGEKGSEKFSPHLRGAGIAFLLLEAGIPELLFGVNKNKRFSFGLKKAFAFPWGYQNVFSSGGGETADVFSGDGALSAVRTALLSGLSFSASLSW